MATGRKRTVTEMQLIDLEMEEILLLELAERQNKREWRSQNQNMPVW